MSYAVSMFSNFDWLSNIDTYRDEYEQFRWDVYILIEGTLHAGIRYLDTEAKTELAKIEERMKKPVNDEYQTN